MDVHEQGSLDEGPLRRGALTSQPRGPQEKAKQLTKMQTRTSMPVPAWALMLPSWKLVFMREPVAI
jgi:hypothetical protein